VYVRVPLLFDGRAWAVVACLACVLRGSALRQQIQTWDLSDPHVHLLRHYLLACDDLSRYATDVGRYAKLAGLRRYDQILAIDGVPLPTGASKTDVMSRLLDKTATMLLVVQNPAFADGEAEWGGMTSDQTVLSDAIEEETASDVDVGGDVAEHAISSVFTQGRIGHASIDRTLRVDPSARGKIGHDPARQDVLVVEPGAHVSSSEGSSSSGSWDANPHRGGAQPGRSEGDRRATTATAAAPMAETQNFESAVRSASLPQKRAATARQVQVDPRGEQKAAEQDTRVSPPLRVAHAEGRADASDSDESGSDVDSSADVSDAADVVNPAADAVDDHPDIAAVGAVARPHICPIAEIHAATEH
jgi:hypothetical protein